MTMRKPANPVLWLVIVLPLLAIAGGLASLALAFVGGDRELPRIYHWEGAGLDRDQQREALATQRHISATIEFDYVAQRCTIALRGAAPAALRLTVTHPTDSGADRAVSLERHGPVYSAPCTALPAAHWWLELADDQRQWLLRGRLQGELRRPLILDGTSLRAEARP